MIDFTKDSPDDDSDNGIMVAGAMPAPHICPCPTFYFTTNTECKIPDEGTGTIKFRKIEDSENTRDPDSPRYRYELEVSSLDIDGMKDSEEKPVDMLKAGLRKALGKEVK